MLKKSIAMLCLIIFGLLAGCVSSTSVQVTEPTTEPTIQPTQPPTEPTATQEVTEAPFLLALDTENVTVTEIGQQVVIYSGEVPAEEIYWYSGDSFVAMVDRGVVTAMGHDGVTNIFGIYGDQTLVCTVTSTACYQSGRTPVLSPPDYENVDASFFDDAVFVGDSISVSLSQQHNGALGNAQFLAKGGYSIYSAITDSMSIPYNGRQYVNIEEAIAATGAKKVFIMLGINDLGIFGVDATLEHYRILLEMIRGACPDVQIYLQSVTPIWTGSAKRTLNNSSIQIFNFVLRFLAEEYGYGFIDIAPYLLDYTGGLAAAYSSDRYVHITLAGVDVWTTVLRSHAYYGKM